MARALGPKNGISHGREYSCICKKWLTEEPPPDFTYAGPGLQIEQTSLGLLVQHLLEKTQIM